MSEKKFYRDSIVYSYEMRQGESFQIQVGGVKLNARYQHNNNIFWHVVNIVKRNKYIYSCKKFILIVYELNSYTIY